MINECCWQAEPPSKQALKAQKKAAKQEVCARIRHWFAARLTTALLASAGEAGEEGCEAGCQAGQEGCEGGEEG